MGNSYGNSSSQVQAPELPLHLCFFLLVLVAFLALSWFLSFESASEAFADQMRLLLMASPLALLLAVRLLSGANGEARRVGLALPAPDRGSIHRAGGSPWGVALVLVLLLVMVSYQSNFRDRWFPLAGK